MTNENDSYSPPSDSQGKPSQPPTAAPPAPLKGALADDGKRNADATKNEADELAREFRAAEKWVIGTNVVLAIIGIFALCIYDGQLNVMRGQLGEIIRQYPELQKSADAARTAADIGKEALYSAQRAFVIFPADPQVVVFKFPTESFLQLEMPIENAGATQAHATKDRVSCITPKGPLPANYAFPDIAKGRCGTRWAATGANVIPAKGTIYSQGVFVEDKIVQEFMQQNLGPWPSTLGVPSHPTRAVYFYGWVTYRDIFKDSPEHLSEFCRVLTTLFIQGQKVQDEWGYCPVHNCTDEDCPDYKERTKAADAAPICCPTTWFKKEN